MLYLIDLDITVEDLCPLDPTGILSAIPTGVSNINEHYDRTSSDVVCKHPISLPHKVEYAKNCRNIAVRLVDVVKVCKQYFESLVEGIDRKCMNFFVFIFELGSDLYFKIIGLR